MTNKSKNFFTGLLTGKFAFLIVAVVLTVSIGCFVQPPVSAQISDKTEGEAIADKPEFIDNSGAVDTSFTANLLNDSDYFGNSPISAMIKQPDGKLIIAGSFNNVGGILRRGLVRLNTDSSVDRSFDAGVAFSISVLAIQADGKILVGGNFTSFNNVSRSGIVRLNTDGSIDASFEVSSSYNFSVQTIIPLANGKILIAGGFSNIGDLSFPGVAVLNADGNIDDSFNPGVITNNGSQPFISTAAVQPDGKILIAGSFTNINGSVRNRIARLERNGTLDLSFDTGIGPNGQINVIVPLANGKSLVGGDFTSVNGVVRNKIARLNADGSLDNSFNFSAPAEISVRTMVLQPDGKILVAANISYSSALRAVFRLNADGGSDATFESPAVTANSGTSGSVNNLLLENDGKIIISGTFGYVANAPRRSIARLNANGTLDTAYAVPLGQNGTVNIIAVQPDGKILIGGNFTYVNGYLRTRFARLNADGSVDAAFNPVLNAINSGLSNLVTAIAVQPDGKILIGGNFSGGFNYQTNGLIRLNADGSTDTSFNPGVTGNVSTIALQADGKIFIGGGFSQINRVNRIGLARLNADGTLDNSFLPGEYTNTPTYGPNGGIAKLVLQADGKLTIVGTFNLYTGVQRGGIARVNADGTLDTSLNADLTNNSGSINALVIQPDGKILLGGGFNQINGVSRSRLARLNADGSLDASFTTVFGQDGIVDAIELQPDGKILVAGSFNFAFGAVRRKVVRLNPDGSVDSVFNPGGGADLEVFALARQSDGKVLVGGNFTVFDGVTRTGVARLRANACVVSPLYDFDGDGKTDISVYRPAGGAWLRINTTNGGFSQQLFGLPTDRVAPADYDGDGKTDIAVYRPSEGTWYILNSRTGFQSHQFGTSEDRPIPADYDGDGRDDLAVFRPSNGTWYIQRSSLGFTAINFGLSTDVPVIADFDGDCKADIAVFRPSNGAWYWLQSSNGGFQSIQFGTNGDVPVAGDYDGDGKTDTAVFRPSNGAWYFLKTREGFSAVQFGNSTDKPVPADYDGDGKTDVAVYRNGSWYILQSADGKLQSVGFGTGDDQPIPAAYLPR